MDTSRFTAKTVYVIYIADTPEKVWLALTDPAFTGQYFFGRAVEIEPHAGGRFALRLPDGRIDVTGAVVEWTPPRRLAVTWTVDGVPEMRDLPACLVTYAIEPAGESVRLTMTEAHQWDVPDGLLAGGRAGWPAILSSLKSLLETGKALAIAMQPPQEAVDALAARAAAKR
ncbi:MAG TPA: SRPBCC family protein [Xanthobacteraceae bacterium]|nr:SRPBCC family protein [Xanthobacteraceae bacterium]